MEADNGDGAQHHNAHQKSSRRKIEKATHTSNLTQHVIDVKIVNGDSDSNDHPERALHLLACVPSTSTIGPDLYSHITIVTLKAHDLRDYFFKHLAGNTSLPLRHAKGKTIPKTRIELQLGAPAYQT